MSLMYDYHFNRTWQWQLEMVQHPKTSFQRKPQLQSRKCLYIFYTIKGRIKTLVMWLWNCLKVGRYQWQLVSDSSIKPLILNPSDSHQEACPTVERVFDLCCLGYNLCGQVIPTRLHYDVMLSRGLVLTGGAQQGERWGWGRGLQKGINNFINVMEVEVGNGLFCLGSLFGISDLTKFQSIDIRTK